MITTKEEALRVLEDFLHLTKKVVKEEAQRVLGGFLHLTKKVVKNVVKTSEREAVAADDDFEEIDVFGYDTDEDDEEIDIFGYDTDVVDAQNAIIGDDLLEVYQSKGRLMVDLSMYGSDDEEFGMTAEMCSAAGVALIDDGGFVVAHIGVDDVDEIEDAARDIVDGQFHYIKFLSAFEMSIYDEVDEEVLEAVKYQSVYSLDGESWDYRLERCIEAGGYVRSLEESLFYTPHGKSVSFEWGVLESIVGESLNRAELAKKDSATRKKVLSVWDKIIAYFGKSNSFVADLEDAMSAHGAY